MNDRDDDTKREAKMGTMRQQADRYGTTKPTGGFKPLGLYVDGQRVRKVAYLGKPVAEDVLAWMEARRTPGMGDWLMVLVPAENPADAPLNIQRIFDASRAAGADALAHDAAQGSMPPNTVTVMVQQDEGDGGELAEIDAVSSSDAASGEERDTESEPGAIFAPDLDLDTAMEIAEGYAETAMERLSAGHDTLVERYIVDNMRRLLHDLAEMGADMTKLPESLEEFAAIERRYPGAG